MLFRSGLMAVLALAAGGFWYWAAGERSLAAILHTLQRHMPAGSSLQVEGVSGSLRAGGHIDRLVYRKNGQTSAPQRIPCFTSGANSWRFSLERNPPPVSTFSPLNPNRTVCTIWRTPPYPTR